MHNSIAVINKNYQTVSRRRIYRNARLELWVDKVKLPNGNTCEQAYFVKPRQHATGILAVEDNALYLVRQYRYAAQQWLWQIPMGTAPYRSTLLCARKELQEETGLIAQQWTRLGIIRPEPGMMTQATHIFLAEELSRGKQCLEDTEAGMTVKKFAFEEMEKMIAKGKITCGYTLSAWLLYTLITKRK